MKKKLFNCDLTVLCLLMVIGFAFADNFASTEPAQDNIIIDRIGVEGPLEFNKTIFNLAWTAKPNDAYYVQEYLPDGENLKSFNQMLAIHLFIKDLKPNDAVQQKIEELKKRKKNDPICNFAIFKSPDGKEFLLDFLVGEIEDNRYTLVEFNVYRYKQIDLSDEKKALMVYTYCKRSYGTDIKPFLNTLKNSRMDYINQMSSTKIPDVTIGNN